LALTLLACGQAGVTHITTPAPKASLPHGWTVVTYTAALPYVYQPGVTELKVTTGCQPGERMVGAGYAATDVFEYNANITSSYPTDDHTWVVTSGTQAGLQIDVYCLHGDHLPTVVIVSNAVGDVECSTGATLLAAGFGQPVDGSTAQPSYALCATAGVAPGKRTTAPVTFDSMQHGYMPASGIVRCPAGQTAFGGGANGVHYFASEATANFSGWQIIGGGQASGTVYADCVRLL
jgi:hypothetical protein